MSFVRTLQYVSGGDFYQKGVMDCYAQLLNQMSSSIQGGRR